jgi:hypothetical protein
MGLSAHGVVSAHSEEHAVSFLDVLFSKHIGSYGPPAPTTSRRHRAWRPLSVCVRVADLCSHSAAASLTHSVALVAVIASPSCYPRSRSPNAPPPPRQPRDGPAPRLRPRADGKCAIAVRIGTISTLSRICCPRRPSLRARLLSTPALCLALSVSLTTPCKS